MHLDKNILYGWPMSRKFLVNSFKWRKNVSKFDKDVMKNYDEVSNKECILEVDVKYPEKCT